MSYNSEDGDEHVEQYLPLRAREIQQPDTAPVEGRLVKFLQTIWKAVRGYGEKDFRRSQEAGVKLLEGKAAVVNAEAARIVAEAAEIHAKAEYLRAEAGALTIISRAEAFERYSAALKNLKSKNGGMIMDPEDLARLLRLLEGRLPDPTKPKDSYGQNKEA